MTSAEACSVSKQLASTSFRRQLLGKLLVQLRLGSSGNVRLSYPLMSFLSKPFYVLLEFNSVLSTAATIIPYEFLFSYTGYFKIHLEFMAPLTTFQILSVTVFFLPST